VQRKKRVFHKLTVPKELKKDAVQDETEEPAEADRGRQQDDASSCFARRKRQKGKKKIEI
jgi:hypothetical protein